MIRWSGKKNDRTIVGFGLFPLDIAKLLSGTPISILGKQFGVEFDIIIHFGTDENTGLTDLLTADRITQIDKVRIND